MDRKIRSLIKALERQYGFPVQIVVEEPKETICALKGDSISNRDETIFSTQRKVYGSLAERSCEILPLPTDDKEIKHDLELFQGKYDSVTALNDKIHEVEKLDHLCMNPLDFHQGLRQYLATKFKVEEKVISAAHGGIADWYVVDGTEADLGDWKRNRPDLYEESVNFLKNNNVPFRYHYLIAAPSGLYIEGKRGFVAE